MVLCSLCCPLQFISIKVAGEVFFSKMLYLMNMLHADIRLFYNVQCTISLLLGIPINETIICELHKIVNMENNSYEVLNYN